MLDVERRIILADLPGVLIFADDKLMAGFYAIPASPRLAAKTPGELSVGFTLLGKKQGNGFRVTGGFLALTTTLELHPEENVILEHGLTEHLLKQHPAASEEHPPTPHLLVPEWLAGEVEVSLLPQLTLKGRPSMFGVNDCVLQQHLTATQAQSLSTAWEAGLPDAGICYRACLRAANVRRSEITVQTVSSEVRSDTSSVLTSATNSTASHINRRQLTLTLRSGIDLPPGELNRYRRQVIV